MRSELFRGITAAILTVSDSCFSGQCEDVSGQRLEKLLRARGAHILRKELVPDEKEKIIKALRLITDKLRIKLVLTTGGTGLSPRDVTPEATGELVERQIPGIAELMRLSGLKKTRRAALSRSVAGVRKGSIIINLPGSPAGAAESFEAVADILPHAFAMLRGEGH